MLDFLCERTGGGRVNVKVESDGSARFPSRRARFYSSLLDAWSLGSGEKYEALPDCALVVVCGKDPFDRGLPRYAVRRRFDD